MICICLTLKLESIELHVVLEMNTLTLHFAILMLDEAGFGLPLVSLGLGLSEGSFLWQRESGLCSYSFNRWIMALHQREFVSMGKNRLGFFLCFNEAYELSYWVS